MSLRQKIENHFRNRSGQGGLVGVIIAAVILSTIIAAGTEWYLSMNKSTGRMQEQMEAQSYAYNEWQKVLAEDYNGLSSKDRKNVSDKFDLKRDVGAEKTISGNGKEKDVVITVYRKGTDQIAYAMQSGKARPTLDEYYTKSQVDSKITALQNEMKKMSMPIGTILPYVGSLSNIPSGWRLCDGTNGTPNLKGMFLRGWSSQNIGGNTYSGGNIGMYQTDAIKDTFGKGSIVTTMSILDHIGKNKTTGVFTYTRALGYRVGGDVKYDTDAVQINFDLTNGQNTANEFRPVNYSVYYIIKVN